MFLSRATLISSSGPGVFRLGLPEWRGSRSSRRRVTAASIRWESTALPGASPKYSPGAVDSLRRMGPQFNRFTVRQKRVFTVK